jgi:ADP-ribose pyrophosphatase YjhB (NUDIX family)
MLRGRRPQIHLIGREPTSGGVVFRPSKNQPGDIEILLIQDIKKRWTIPKGHIEPGETAKQTAIREIGEEVGLNEVEVLSWLGKTEFKYRRLDKLVLMTMQVYLVRALGDTDAVKPEDWMQGAKWFSFNEALDKIEYEDIGDLMLLAKQKIRKQGIAK